MARISTDPDAGGHFGRFGGKYVPEALMHALDELEQAFTDARTDDEFNAELDTLRREYAGRPTPLWRARRLTETCGGARIYLKREDLAHTGAHKINNVLGQCLLARRMGKKRIIAETGAGQHGVATATAAALFGQECIVYMGEEDTHRQALNVFRMELLGATVVPVTAGSRTLKDAINEALRDWVTNVETTHSIPAGLDYPGVGPEHAYLREQGLADYETATDDEALDAFSLLARTEGILPALESSHAIAWIAREARALGTDAVAIVNLSGRGDKDVETVRSIMKARDGAH